MPKSFRTCKICGKAYPYCITELKKGDIFRWQDVACCPEHGTEYFTQIAISRGETPVVNEDKKKPGSKAPAPKKARKKKSVE